RCNFFTADAVRRRALPAQAHKRRLFIGRKASNAPLDVGQIGFGPIVLASRQLLDREPAGQGHDGKPAHSVPTAGRRRRLKRARSAGACSSIAQDVTVWPIRNAARAWAPSWNEAATRADTVRRSG